MTYTSRSRWVDYLVLGLSVFLIFCLLFDTFIEPPRLVAWFGRWHPVVLHFPIVLLLIAIFLGVTGKKIPRLLLIVSVISALVTAISGFFLGKETPIKGDLLFWHQWLGGAVALLAALWYMLTNLKWGQAAIRFIQIVMIVLIGFTGHYGGMVTHGDDFLALPLERKRGKIPENPLIYADVVTRILGDKCISCHNPNKQKGQLLMTSLPEMIKGGESGSAIIPGDPEQSELIRRVHLPTEDEEYMPPEGKIPLNDTEIGILERWIALGASDTVRLNQLEKNEPLVSLIATMIEPDAGEKWAEMPKVADSTLQNLSSDYLTIKRVASNLEALSIDGYLPPQYDPEPILALKRVAQNIVELDLSGLPLGEKEIDMIASCVNLNWLELDKTPLNDDQIEKLGNLDNLEMLKVYETAITDKSLTVFQNLPKLKQLYLWGTAVSEKELEAFRAKKTSVTVNTGIDPDTRAFFIETDSVIETTK